MGPRDSVWKCSLHAARELLACSSLEFGAVHVRARTVVVSVSTCHLPAVYTRSKIPITRLCTIWWLGPSPPPRLPLPVHASRDEGDRERNINKLEGKNRSARDKMSFSYGERRGPRAKARERARPGGKLEAGTMERRLIG